MPATTLAVSLLAHTPDALSLIYAAFRQCYHPGYVADMWPRLLSGEIAQEKQAEFVSRILASGHESPVEHVSFTFAVAGVSRALSHQLVRHRIASYSQQSQRYVDAAGFDYVLPPQIAAIPEARARFEAAMAQAGAAYAEIQEILAAQGRGAKANEDARFVLPNACETKVVVTMNCRSLLHFFELRCCMRAQWEIRAMACAMLGLCREALPVIFAGAGARCERLGYCPEDERFSCGRYPRLAQMSSSSV
ncbi:FAD-dependent thymidylate synthase [Solidesulfovibrio sp.]|jgi:thymidylate synthase (FAD)|uniref:FAD-dependent thymidylate synthase n=1 Tax=Solidesulfovibrio sp. TaxID=2910990 RepID=UPI000EBAC325|nr:FAD-dependent thymidylate synthase [Solidesulfovibrio sp.]MEA5090944.1 FAD-dependent thymidylate synthase [Solidesulfovibrio sp.]HCR12630.1 FAD-dependent thymidylate synthase [Desulfovibrio sp.]HML62189.1 FAD-dependent thymidylate synthase [Solidesulfovibrio sp.]